MKKNLLFIINPNSGNKRGAEVISIIPQCLDLTKYNYTCQLTKYPHHATELAQQAVTQGYFAVIAVGGDGIVNEAFQPLVSTDLAFSIIPMGSGNGVARSLGLPMKIRKAIAQLNNASIETMDTAKLNGRPFLGVAGIGFDGLIAHEFSNTKKRGLWSYIKLIIRNIYAFNGFATTVETSETKHKCDAFILTIANTQQYGNDAIIAPLAKIDDGKLDLVIVRKHSKWLLPFLVAKVMSGNTDKSRFVETISADRFTINTSYKKAHLDGEPITVENNVSVQILPMSLKILR